jgi:hypothetical protein
MNLRVLASVACVSLVTACLAVACDKGSVGEGTLSVSEATITPTTTNERVTPDYTYRQETSAAFVTGYSNEIGTGRWVVGWNNNAGPTAAGWSISNSYKATTWTDNVQSSGTAWGNPGNSPYDNASFSGWRSDPSIVAVTNPATNNGGKTMLYSMVACTNNCSEVNDVIVAVSADNGGTWGNTTYVSGQGSGGSPDHGGGSVDNPWMASNQVSPYDTFIAWDRTSDSTGWLAQLSVTSPDSGSPGVSVSNIVQIPKPSGGGYIGHPRIAVGQYTPCTGAAREAVFVTYANFSYGRCGGGEGPKGTTAANWQLAVYDTTGGGSWLGPWQVDATTLAWPNCVGGGTGPEDAGCSNNNPFCADNDPRAHIAVDWSATHGIFFINHTVNPAGHGTRVEVDQGYLACESGSVTPVVTKVIDPPPCDPNPLNGQCTWGDAGIGPDGGPYVQDEWAQTISFNFNGTTPRVVESWFTTRDDPNNVNVDMYMMYSENLGVTWSAVQEVTYGVSGDVIPWNYHLGDWSDYQSLSPDTIHGGFLAAWGGDCRSDAGTCTIYSDIMQ